MPPQIPAVFLTTLLDALEVGYGKYRNPYHNQAHAADVTQTVHCFLLRTGMLVWGQRGDSVGSAWGHCGVSVGTLWGRCGDGGPLGSAGPGMLVATETAPPGDSIATIATP